MQCEVVHEAGLAVFTSPLKHAEPLIGPLLLPSCMAATRPTRSPHSPTTSLDLQMFYYAGIT